MDNGRVQGSPGMKELREIGSAGSEIVRKTPSLEKVHCGCHKPVEDHTTRKAVLRLIVASLIALVFVVAEVLGEEATLSYTSPPSSHFWW